MPEIGMILREGKGKKVYATDDPDKAIVYFKDEAMAFHGLKRGRILGKGEVNNAICEHLFSLPASWRTGPAFRSGRSWILRWLNT